MGDTDEGTAQMSARVESSLCDQYIRHARQKSPTRTQTDANISETAIFT